MVARKQGFHGPEDDLLADFSGGEAWYQNEGQQGLAAEDSAIPRRMVVSLVTEEQTKISAMGQGGCQSGWRPLRQGGPG